MALANAHIPHITYVEEIDVTALEELRAALNKAASAEDRPRLTLLPFLMRAMVQAIAEQPSLNALFDDEAGVIHQHGGVHIGIATQTPSGLMVPVVRHAEARDLWGCAAELTGSPKPRRRAPRRREELTGSTITITSLGAMGGVVTTPIINHPEVAIIGVNKIMMRPVWDGTAFVPRKMMNLSSSFDHRVIDGWDAAVFVQRIKALLETPALIFMEELSHERHLLQAARHRRRARRLCLRDPGGPARHRHGAGRGEEAWRHLPQRRLHSLQGADPCGRRIREGRAHRRRRKPARHLGPASPTLDLAKTVAWKDGIVGRLTAALSALLKKAGVKIVEGRAKFRDGKTVEVETETGPQIIRAERGRDRDRLGRRRACRSCRSADR